MKVRIEIDACPSDHLAQDLASVIHADLFDPGDVAEPTMVDVYYNGQIYCSGFAE